jgi:hypothetical protein
MLLFFGINVTFKPVGRFRKVHNREIVSMSFNSSDTYIASVGQDSEFRATSLRHVDKRSGWLCIKMTNNHVFTSIFS